MVAPSSHRSDNHYVLDLTSWIKGRAQLLRMSTPMWLDALLCALLGHHDVTALDDEFVSHGFPPVRFTQDDPSVPRAGDRRGVPGRVADDTCSATPCVSPGIKRRERRPWSG
jgi:hypothetical protein